MDIGTGGPEPQGQSRRLVRHRPWDALADWSKAAFWLRRHATYDFVQVRKHRTGSRYSDTGRSP